MPFNPSQAGGEFGSMCFMVGNAGTTETVTRTVFRARAIYVIMWTGHGSYILFLHDFRAKIQLFLHMCNFFCIFVAKMIYGYIRVSSDKQTVENQRFEIQKFCEREKLSIDGWIEETISGTKAYNKRQLGVLLKRVEKEDVIICSELSRLGRSLFMIMEILSICMKKECRVWTIKDNYRLGDDIQSKVLAFAFGLSAEIERNLISQRTKEALARKRAEGGNWWHDRGQRLRLNPKCVTRHKWIEEQLYKGTSKTIIAKRLHISTCTLYRYLTYTGLYVPQHCIRECWAKYGIFR